MVLSLMIFKKNNNTFGSYENDDEYNKRNNHRRDKYYGFRIKCEISLDIVISNKAVFFYTNTGVYILILFLQAFSLRLAFFLLNSQTRHLIVFFILFNVWARNS
ncbi:hypothetical protein BDA99DRAFT_531239 [Phascolomyces articulosus]|uniref:Uncharacterized protein n=1 Tax=Phascolomyces articulosus TaxID=60185 RepID=A0AAD5PKD7_9FUNG|nr:hypothetical protein BDA99DRAFT_531239 [Phascolomyces articulosus]